MAAARGGTGVTGATGAAGADWALMPAGALARFEAVAWTALSPPAGAVVFVLDERRLVVRQGDLT